MNAPDRMIISVSQKDEKRNYYRKPQWSEDCRQEIIVFMSSLSERTHPIVLFRLTAD